MGLKKLGDYSSDFDLITAVAQKKSTPNSWTYYPPKRWPLVPVLLNQPPATWLKHPCSLHRPHLAASVFNLVDTGTHCGGGHGGSRALENVPSGCKWVWMNDTKKNRRPESAWAETAQNDTSSHVRCGLDRGKSLNDLTFQTSWWNIVCILKLTQKDDSKSTIPVPENLDVTPECTHVLSLNLFGGWISVYRRLGKWWWCGWFI